MPAPPWCLECSKPVRSWSIANTEDPDRVTLHVECHGVTEDYYLPRVRSEQERAVLIPRRSGTDGDSKGWGRR